VGVKTIGWMERAGVFMEKFSVTYAESGLLTIFNHFRNKAARLTGDLEAEPNLVYRKRHGVIWQLCGKATTNQCLPEQLARALHPSFALNSMLIKDA
jgi:hypothetical protein